MAKQPKTVAAQPAAYDAEKLAAVVNATVGGGFLYMTDADVAPLVAAELVETNPAMTDEHGSVATRATQKGIDTMNTNSAPAASEAATEAATEAAKAPRVSPSSFVIDDDVAVPTIKRGGGRGGDMYPFDTLAVGQSFHIAATEAKPNPAKSLASTVSSATKRYADQTPARKFIVRSVDASDKRGAGARVFRTE